MIGRYISKKILIKFETYKHWLCLIYKIILRTSIAKHITKIIIIDTYINLSIKYLTSKWLVVYFQKKKFNLHVVICFKTWILQYFNNKIITINLCYRCNPTSRPPKLFSMLVADLDSFFAVSTGNWKLKCTNVKNCNKFKNVRLIWVKTKYLSLIFKYINMYVRINVY